MVALLDVNILVALFDPDHVHHDLAHDWFVEQRVAGWATCPITENGFVRVLSSPQYRPSPPKPVWLMDRLRRFCASGHHAFWPDSISLRDTSLFPSERHLGHQHLTDMYLLTLAKSMRGALATFDKGLVTAAGGRALDHLLLIQPL